MTARVIFLNTLHYPDFHEYQELDRIQYELELYCAEIEYQAKEQGLNDLQRRIFKEASHRNLRHQMKVIKD